MLIVVAVPAQLIGELQRLVRRRREQRVPAEEERFHRGAGVRQRRIHADAAFRQALVRFRRRSKGGESERRLRENPEPEVVGMGQRRVRFLETRLAGVRRRREQKAASTDRLRALITPERA